MMCGVSGSGKTTYAKDREKEGYVRLSIDEQVWEEYGQINVDFPSKSYERYTELIEGKLRIRLIELLQIGENVVLDFSFWNREKRMEYRALIENHHGIVKLIYLKASLSVLQSRLQKRNQEVQANAPYEITDKILQTFYSGFDEPQNEGEIVIEQS